VITRLEAHGYRCFPSLSIDLDRYHVLAGANGADNTTLLDIPCLSATCFGGRGSSSFLSLKPGS
jgi:predicted ATPase